MTFPEIVKTTLWDIIDEMSRSLSSFVKNPDKDFIRKRKLDFKKMMHLIISMESGSLNHELLKFFEYDSSVPTGSAFYQQRSKLSVSAFRHLLKEFNLKFPLEKFRGKYYLIACDGSEFNIARNLKDADTFHEPNGKSVSGFNMVHTISLYEVCSKRYLDLEVQPGRLKNEFQAICNLMDRYAYGGSPIFIADRGFSSYNVFAHAIENHVDFLIRAKDLNVQRFLGVETLPDKLDTTIELILTRTQSKKKHKHPENIITTLSKEDFTPDDIKYCYNLRWGIETSFRDLKHTIGATNLHSKKTEFVAFELLSRLILYNFCSIVILHVPVKSKNRKYEYQVGLIGIMPASIESKNRQASHTATHSTNESAHETQSFSKELLKTKKCQRTLDTN